MLLFDKAFSTLKGIFGRDRGVQIPFSELFMRFQNILRNNTAAMELIADMGGKTGGEFVFDKKYLKDSVEKLTNLVRNSAYDLNYITKNKYLELYDVIEEQYQNLNLELSGKIAVPRTKHIFFLEEIEEGMEDIVGNKAYNISRIHNLPNMNIPPCFVVAIGAFRDYIAYNDPFDKIAQLIDEYVREQKSVESVSHAIRLIILGGEIPPELRREILHAAVEISGGDPERTFFSVRSSAIGEDGDLSFAGIYDSFLNVEYGELLSMFKKVLASLYNQASLEYRMRMNLFPMEMAMPVLYQKMVRSRVSGVLYTLDPNAPEETECVISGSWGLGKTVVEGQVSVDTFRVSRREPYSVVRQEINSKTWMVPPYEKGPPSPVPPHLQNIPCLNHEEIGRIVECGLLLERYFKSPLDIEWSLDEEDSLWILQARPIRISRPAQVRDSDLRDALKEHRVLLKDQGVIAYRGVGIGRVWLFDDRADLNDFPSGAILVARHAAPILAKVIPRANAVITDIGSLTGHMATVAREFRVPTIVGTGTATRVLRPGQL
ncbi:MAG: hypothetical protein JRJ29_21190, partial [Deltaproteobacteria bacterium]|nr:hypothetical protein [Deltaproteobacteria bacterium]